MPTPPTTPLFSLVTTTLPTLPPQAQTAEHLRRAAGHAEEAYARAFRVAVRCGRGGK